MSRISEHGFKKEKKTIGGITIYNIDKELKNELFKQFVNEFVNNFNPETKKMDIKIPDRELLLAYLPQLTDLEFDTNNELEILNIIENPDKELEMVMDEVKSDIRDIMQQAGEFIIDMIQNNIKMTRNMTQEQINKYYEELKKINQNSKITNEDEKISENELEEFKEWKKTHKVGK
jgi:hypothetical protein